MCAPRRGCVLGSTQVVQFSMGVSKAVKSPSIPLAVI